MLPPKVNVARPRRCAIIRELADATEPLAEFCRRRHVRRLSLFGSVLTDRFRHDSDVDILIEFQDGYVTGFLGLAEMERELSALVAGRKVDLRTPAELSRYFRDNVLHEARVIYAA